VTDRRCSRYCRTALIGLISVALFWLFYVLGRSRAINVITQFGKCQLNKTFCYTQNSLWNCFWPTLSTSRTLPFGHWETADFEQGENFGKLPQAFQIIKNMLMTLTTHHLHPRWWMEWRGECWVYCHRRNPRLRNYSEGEAFENYILFHGRFLSGSYTRGAARAMYNQVGPSRTESWCVVWSSMESGTIITSLVYTISFYAIKSSLFLAYRIWVRRKAVLS